MAKDTKKCPKCRANVAPDCEICPQCQSPIAGVSRWKAIVFSTLQAGALIASMVAIAFMIWSNLQTKELLRSQQEAIGLQREDLAKTDSSIVVIREQIETQRQANEYQREFNEIIVKATNASQKEYIEKQRPLLTFANIDCKVEDQFIVLYLNIENRGSTSASDVMLKVRGIDYLDLAVKDSFDIVYRRILPGQLKIDPVPFHIRSTFVAECELKWSWSAFNFPDSLRRFMIVRHDSSSGTCDQKELTEDMLPIYWNDSISGNPGPSEGTSNGAIKDSG